MSKRAGSRWRCRLMSEVLADLSQLEARRIALAAQGFAEPRPSGRVDIRHLRRVLDRVGLLQIDSVNVLVRSHYLPLFSRLGPYRMGLLDDATYGRRELFEAWAHEASLVPVGHYPLLQHRREAERPWERFDQIAREHPGYVAAVLAQVRDRGPLTTSELDDPGDRTGPWWGYGRGKVALEYHFFRGDVAVHSRKNFTRYYDLPERVFPPEVLAAAGPGQAPDAEEAQRSLLVMAARSHGVGTAKDLADYYRLRVPECRRRLGELVVEGLLREVRVEGWKQPAYLHPEARLPKSTAHRLEGARALLSPFDSLIWERDRTERLFDFRYRLEIYVPQPKRVFGYYVLPFLLGDALVGRVDLKADRAKGRLLVRGAFVEEGHDAGEVAESLAGELRLMAGWLGLERVVVGRRGGLSGRLRAALRR